MVAARAGEGGRARTPPVLELRASLSSGWQSPAGDGPAPTIVEKHCTRSYRTRARSSVHWASASVVSLALLEPVWPTSRPTLPSPRGAQGLRAPRPSRPSSCRESQRKSVKEPVFPRSPTTSRVPREPVPCSALPAQSPLALPMALQLAPWRPVGWQGWAPCPRSRGPTLSLRPLPTSWTMKLNWLQWARA